VASDVDAHDKAQREVTDALEDLEKAERKFSEKQRDLDEAKEKARAAGVRFER
jgi:outer membrane protein TolC